jgi:hypothetical protein
MLRRRQAKTGQRIKVYFVSDHDPSGFDLQRSWEDAMEDFGVIVEFIRVGLTRDQVRDNNDVRGNPLEDLSIEVKKSDSRSENYIAQYGNACWEADILPASVIAEDLDADVRSWLDAKLWKQRDREIKRARTLL